MSFLLFLSLCFPSLDPLSKRNNYSPSLDPEKELLCLEAELTTLCRQREPAGGQRKREWIVWRRLRPSWPAESPVEVVRCKVDQVRGDLRIALEEQAERLRRLWSTWESQHQDKDLVSHNEPDLVQISLVRSGARATPVATEEPNSLPGGPDGSALVQNPLAPGPEDGPAEGQAMDQEAAAPLILAILPRTMGRVDRAVAREVGCFHAGAPDCSISASLLAIRAFLLRKAAFSV